MPDMFAEFSQVFDGYADSLRPHTLTYWAPGTPDGFGNVGFAAPVTMTGYWEDKQRLYTGKNGQQVVSESVVVCTSPVAIKGYLIKGVSTSLTPRTVAGASEIKAIEAIEDHYTAIL
jgi:hypothetical protein